MSGCVVRGVSVLGPGLALWEAARLVLRGEAPFEAGPVVPPMAAMLPPNERRRAGLSTRLALAVCNEAVAMAGLAPGDVRAVFASSNGQGDVVHGLLETLAGDAPMLSPTQFHNSVHNAVAGYWSIGAGSARPVTCLGCGDSSFASGVLKAVAEAQTERCDTLLCVYDVPMPEPLHACRPMDFPFAAAVVFSPEGGASGLARVGLRYVAGRVEDGLPATPGLRPLAMGNAAARGLRFLEVLARGEGGRIMLECFGAGLDVEVFAVA